MWARLIAAVHATLGVDMHAELEALSIAQFHGATLASPVWPRVAPRGASAWHGIHANHRRNTLLCHHDMRMRGPAIAPHEVAASQRRSGRADVKIYLRFKIVS